MIVDVCSRDGGYLYALPERLNEDAESCALLVTERGGGLAGVASGTHLLLSLSYHCRFVSDSGDNDMKRANGVAQIELRLS